MMCTGFGNEQQELDWVGVVVCPIKIERMSTVGSIWDLATPCKGG